MKKIIVALLLLVCLTGCVTYNEESFKADLDAYLDTVNEPLTTRTNNNLSYYSFYLPSDMTFVDCLDESVVLKYSNSKMVININISNLINMNYYQSHVLQDDGFFIEDSLVYSHEGTYLNINGITTKYFIKVYSGDPYFTIHLTSEDLNIFAYSLKEEALETAKHMMLVARNCVIDTEEIVDRYSQADVISYQRKQLELFQYVIPKTGYLEDLLNE